LDGNGGRRLGLDALFLRQHMLLLLLGLHLRPGHEILPAEKYSGGKHDGDQKILVVHVSLLQRRHGIETFRSSEPVNGVATQNAFQRKPESFERSVNLYGFDRVARAGGLVTAGGRQHRRDEASIKADGRDQRGSACAPERRCRAFRQFASPRLGLSSRAWAAVSAPDRSLSSS